MNKKNCTNATTHSQNNLQWYTMCNINKKKYKTGLCRIVMSMSGGGSLQLTKYFPLSHCTYCKDLLLFDNVHVLRHKFREVLHSSLLSTPVLGKEY